MKFTSLTKLIPIVTGLALVTGIAWSDETDMNVKVVELKAIKDKNINIELVDDQNNHIFITDDDLADEYLLEEKLATLDEDTRALIRKTIARLKGDGATNVFVQRDDGEHESVKKMFIMNNSDNHVIHLDQDVEQSFVKRGKLLIVDNDDHAMGAVKLTGVSDAIIRMINMGEFTSDELDEIQSALDLKR